MADEKTTRGSSIFTGFQVDNLDYMKPPLQRSLRGKTELAGTLDEVSFMKHGMRPGELNLIVAGRSCGASSVIAEGCVSMENHDTTPTPVDTSDEQVALMCVYVSRSIGEPNWPKDWRKRVNDLIRTLRDERNAYAAAAAKLQNGQ